MKQPYLAPYVKYSLLFLPSVIYHLAPSKIRNKKLITVGYGI